MRVKTPISTAKTIALATRAVRNVAVDAFVASLISDLMSVSTGTEELSNARTWLREDGAFCGEGCNGACVRVMKNLLTIAIDVLYFQKRDC